MLLKLLGSELGAGSPNKLGSTSHLQGELGRHVIAKRQREEDYPCGQTGKRDEEVGDSRAHPQSDFGTLT